MKLSIMTYNIQHGLDYLLRLNNNIRKVDLNKISIIIAEYNPNIVCFNEVYGNSVSKDDNEEFFDQIKELARINNYSYYLFTKAIDTKNGPYGNAIMSKIPFNDYKIIHIDDPIIKDEKVFYESRVLTKFIFKDFDLIHTHFGLAKSEQLNAYNTLINIVSNKKTLFIGDLNMTPDNKIIKMINNIFVDSTIEYNKRIDFTFPSNNPFKKIDYIFVSKDIKVLSSNVINYISSDHLPIYTEVDI